MELPGAEPDGPLGRGLSKLASALGEDDTTGVRIDLDQPPLTDTMADAVRADAQMRIRYRSPSRDEVTERLIVPRQVFTDRGEWYVSADDDRSGEMRTFRIDRIESAEPTGEFVPAGDEPLPTPGDWFADGSIPRATVRFGPSARWVIERYPVDQVSEPDDDGWVTVQLPIASEHWLRCTLVRLGTGAELLEPEHWSEIGTTTAASVLERYRRS
jgi:proteasome accessory factor C